MGEYQHNIDTKGRLIMPAKFRESLGEKFVITRGMDGCLFGYPQVEWEQLEQKLQAMPVSKKETRAFVRFFFIQQQPNVNLTNKDVLVCQLH